LKGLFCVQAFQTVKSGGEKEKSVSVETDF
jgi:hypothetical protein